MITRACRFSSIIVALLCFMGSSETTVTAQTANSALQSIRTAIIQATGVEDATLDLKTKGGIFIVSRINSTMNQTSHSIRDNEASRIATVVGKSVAENAAYRNIHTIRVLYVVTLKPGGSEKIIDTIDFRRDQSGVFHFHAT
jgi:hypothetical protein